MGNSGMVDKQYEKVADEIYGVASYRVGWIQYDIHSSKYERFGIMWNGKESLQVDDIREKALDGTLCGGAIREQVPKKWWLRQVGDQKVFTQDDLNQELRRHKEGKMHLPAYQTGPANLTMFVPLLFTREPPP